MGARPFLADTFVSKLTCFEPSVDFDGDDVADLSDFDGDRSRFTDPQSRNPVSRFSGYATFDLHPDVAVNLLGLPFLRTAMKRNIGRSKSRKTRGRGAS